MLKEVTVKKLESDLDFESERIGVPDLPPCSRVYDVEEEERVELDAEEEEEVNQYLSKKSERINNIE